MTLRKEQLTSSGVIFALDGSIQKIGPNIILCAPKSIGVGGSINLDADYE